MLYRVPVDYKVARPFRSGGLAMGVGDVLSAAQLVEMNLASMVDSRHLRPFISESAQRQGAEVLVADPMERHTIAEVMRIVGDDPEIAKAYLEAEQESEKPRSTLVGSLMATIKTGQDSPA
jgi:hypothetical protein